MTTGPRRRSTICRSGAQTTRAGSHPSWGVAARAALEVSLKLASSTDWLRDSVLRGLLKGSNGDDACAALSPEPSPIDAALDASLLDALRSAVLLDDVM